MNIYVVNRLQEYGDEFKLDSNPISIFTQKFADEEIYINDAQTVLEMPYSDLMKQIKNGALNDVSKSEKELVLMLIESSKTTTAVLKHDVFRLEVES